MTSLILVHAQKPARGMRVALLNGETATITKVIKGVVWVKADSDGVEGTVAYWRPLR